jgi:uncharacterized delta-60 repeat protein
MKQCKLVPSKTRNLILLLVTLCSLLTTTYAQVDTAWVRSYNGSGNSGEIAYAIVVDNSGNVYVTGQSWGSVTLEDYATIKYNSLGVEQWVARYNGPGNSWDYASAIAVDGQGNVYVTGYSVGSSTNYDYATIKYNSLGVEQWVARYNGPGNYLDKSYAIALDGAGNVYVTGGSYGSGTGGDYATIKYNPAGVEQWVQRYNGPRNDYDVAYAIAVDGAGNVYMTGWSSGSGTSGDYATIKYNSLGVEQWVARYNGPGNSDDCAYAIAVDGSGNVYVTGECYGSDTSSDYATIKYNSLGVEQWVARYNGPGNYLDKPYAIAIDGSGNVYVTGYSVRSGINADYAIIKYNSLGVQQWIQRYNGPGNGGDCAYAIAVDGSGNVYVTGGSDGSGTGGDYATIKYNSSGVQQWVARYNGPGNDWDEAYAIAVDGSGNVYVTGKSYGSGTYYDYTTIKYVQTPGVEEARGQMQEAREIEIYPNPAKAFFTLRLPQSGDREQIKIYDVSGKVVKELESSGNRELRILLDGIKNGVYFVQLGNEMVREKLVITK